MRAEDGTGPARTTNHQTNPHHRDQVNTDLNGDARQNVRLHIPELDPDTDNCTAALAYANAGWYVLPAQEGTKHPGSVVGKGWQTKSSRDPECPLRASLESPGTRSCTSTSTS